MYTFETIDYQHLHKYACVSFPAIYITLFIRKYTCNIKYQRILPGHRIPQQQQNTHKNNFCIENEN